MPKEKPTDFAYSRREFLDKKAELEKALKTLKKDKEWKVVWEYKHPDKNKAPWWEFYVVLK